MNNKKIKNSFLSKALTLLISFVIALTLWGLVVTYVSKETSGVIQDVPINFDYNKAGYQSLGLEIIETDIQTVDVIVSGPRSVVGTLTAEDVIVYPQITNVRDTGRYNLTLNILKTSSIMDFNIESASDLQVKTRFDRVIEKTFQITIESSNIVIPSEFMMDKVYTTPETITIKGPEKSIATINKVVATLEPQTVTQSSVLPAQLKLYDENGVEISDSFFTFNADEITVTVPVLKEITLPVKVEFINVPQGFDTDTLNLTLSHSSLHLAVPSKIADSLTEFMVGYIDLKTLELGTPFLFDIKMPNGYRNMKGIEQISATIDSNKLVSRIVAVSEIKLLNKGNQDVEVLSQVINNVEIIGEKEVVEALSSGSVIAQIDMARVALAQGQQTVDVEIIIPSTSKAYVKGSYTATIKN